MKPRKPIILGLGAGRSYDMGPLKSVFKADGQETNGKYSISEWWVDPMTVGVDPHSHAEDDVFIVIDGTMSFLIDGEWIDARRGSFVLVPGGMVHAFENRTSLKAGLLNFSIPGGFEENMEMIVDWYRENPVRKLDR